MKTTKIRLNPMMNSYKLVVQLIKLYHAGLQRGLEHGVTAQQQGESYESIAQYFDEERDKSFQLNEENTYKWLASQVHPFESVFEVIDDLAHHSISLVDFAFNNCIIIGYEEDSEPVLIKNVSDLEFYKKRKEAA